MTARKLAPVETPAETNGHKDTFAFTPTGGETFTVPVLAKVMPTEKQRYFWHKLNRLQGLEQPQFWLDQAGIPEPVQDKIFLLPDGEWQRFFEEWMADGENGATPGE